MAFGAYSSCVVTQPAAVEAGIVIVSMICQLKCVLQSSTRGGEESLTEFEHSIVDTSKQDWTHCTTGYPLSKHDMLHLPLLSRD